MTDAGQVLRQAAVTTRRVATLLIEAGRQTAGRCGGATGRIQGTDLKHPKVDDLRDDPGDWSKLGVKNKKIGLRTHLASIK